MSDEEIKLRATFWNGLSVGTLVTTLLAPLILMFVLYKQWAEAALSSRETLIFSGTLLMGFIFGMVFRMKGIETIRKLKSSPCLTPPTLQCSGGLETLTAPGSTAPDRPVTT